MCECQTISFNNSTTNVILIRLLIKNRQLPTEKGSISKGKKYLLSVITIQLMMINTFTDHIHSPLSRFQIHFNDEVIRATLMSIQFENEPQEHFHLNETGDQSGNTMTKARW